MIVGRPLTELEVRQPDQGFCGGCLWVAAASWPESFGSKACRAGSGYRRPASPAW